MVVLVLLGDIVVGLSVAVAVASLIVVFALLSKYRALVRQAEKSADLAKDVWDSMNSRLTTQDTRIIDIMAKLEVYSARQGPQPATPAKSPPAAITPPRSASRVAQPVQWASQPVSPLPPGASAAIPESAITTKAAEITKETRQTILMTLLEGPKTANQIRDVLDMTREHTGRLMKALYGQGLVARNEQNKPYVYVITDAGRRYLGAAPA